MKVPSGSNLCGPKTSVPTVDGTDDLVFQGSLFLLFITMDFYLHPLYIEITLQVLTEFLVVVSFS